MTFEEHVQWARDAPHWGPSLDAIMSALEALAAERAAAPRVHRYPAPGVPGGTLNWNWIHPPFEGPVQGFGRGPVSYSHWGMFA